MELQQLKFFAEVAKQLHFGRAAERLNASQQVVSYQISQLESELGLRLFRRTTRKVELTLAGEALLEEVEHAFEHLKQGVDKAILAEKGVRGRLVIGYLPIMLYGALPEFVRQYRETYPDVEVVLREQTYEQLEQSLRQGTVDIGFTVYVNDKYSHRNAEWLLFSAQTTGVAMPRHHALSGRESIALSELEGEPFVFLNRAEAPLLFDSYVYSCRQAGFQPNIAQIAASNQSVIGFVAAGIGVAFVLECMSRQPDQAIVFVPLEKPIFEIHLAISWLSDRPSAHVIQFADMVRESL